MDRVWDSIAAQLKCLRGRLFIVGHSLGGALAVIAAFRASSGHHPLISRDAVEVYTFGMPRAGTQAFVDRYAQAGLAERTYRFVHGTDIVPHVPPSDPPFLYRHVGQLYACAAGHTFDLTQKPEAGEAHDHWTYADAALGWVGRLLHPVELPPFPRSDWVGTVADSLPPMIRDHLPDRYMYALNASPQSGAGRD